MNPVVRRRSSTFITGCSDSVKTKRWNFRQTDQIKLYLIKQKISLLDIVMPLVILLFTLVRLLNARHVYGPLWSCVAWNSSNMVPVAFMRFPLKAHWSWAGGLEFAEHSKVRLDPTGKEFPLDPFTVRAMLSGPSEGITENDASKMSLNCTLKLCGVAQWLCR